MDARGDKRLVLVGAASIAVLAYGWWFTDRQPFSPAGSAPSSSRLVS